MIPSYQVIFFNVNKFIVTEYQWLPNNRGKSEWGEITKWQEETSFRNYSHTDYLHYSDVTDMYIHQSLWNEQLTMYRSLYVNYTSTKQWKNKQKLNPPWKIVQRFLKKLKFIELPYDWALQFLSIYLKEMKSLSQSDFCTPIFTVALFTIAKTC